MFRKTVQWLGIVILAHLAAMLIFGIVLAGSVESLERESPKEAYEAIMIFDVIFYIAFVILVSKLETSYADYRRNLKNAIKEEGFTILGYYKKNFFREQLVKAAVLAGFHIPFAVFYQILGLSMTEATVFEQFYILDAGFYGVAGSSILGFLLETAVITAIWFAVNGLILMVLYYQQRKDQISFNS